MVVAFVVQRFANQIDEQLNACGTGTFKDGACVCQHPYTGTHCEIVDCGYGKLVDSVFAYDTITTPKGPTGCECEAQYWGYNCANCTSKYPCTGPCKDQYFGSRCDVLCKSGTENDEPGVLHREAGGTYNYFEERHGFCLRDGTVECREGRAGAHCELECPDCVYGKCNLDDGTCDCFDGYTGALCDLTCPGRCSGLNGVCTEVDMQPVCDCYPGFTGIDCALECCVEGRGTELGSVHGNCTKNVAGCNCFEEIVPHNLPDEMIVDLVYDGKGWQGDECDCHENITCGGRGTCGASGCECASNFQGARCDICADDKVGPFCQYDRYQCPDAVNSHGEFVARNNHGDYACKCNSGFTGNTCEECIASAYPKTGADMCTFIIPSSLCHSGTVNDNYDGTGTMCTCDGHFDNSRDCATCEDEWFGPDCDVQCDSKCTLSNGVCTPGIGCLCPKGTIVVDGECDVCSGDKACVHGECMGGRCQCDPGYYGDLCDITAPSVNGKICNGFPHVMKEDPAPCNTVIDCTNLNHENTTNRAVAIRAAEQNRQMFCHRDDTPSALKGKFGCCMDLNADGFCDADMLENSACVMKPEGGVEIEGENVTDICNQRALEGEVNVFEWCTSVVRGCEKNGTCSDPELCQDLCDNQDEASWVGIWEYEHTRTMGDIMSEPWRFPITFEDPYAYRAFYTDATIEGVCHAKGGYKTCRDHLIPDTTVYNTTHKFSGQWEEIQDYSCGDVLFMTTTVNGAMNYSLMTTADGFETLLPNTAVFALKDGADVTSGSIDTLMLFGKGSVEVVVYNTTSDSCTDLIRKAARDWNTCKDVTFFEFDYDWSGFCLESYDTAGVFNETCYKQSKVCDGCDNYQEGCEGLPVKMDSPMPAPCNEGWDDFCPGYLVNADREGTCAFAECECEGYGVGGRICNLQCPVPQGVTSELSCGSGEEIKWGECIDKGGAVTLGYKQGECDCYNGGDPAKGCALVCDGAQDCSQDVDTPFTFEGNCSDYSDVVKQEGTQCTVNLRDSLCNYYRGRCECATPFTLYSDRNQTVYMNPHDSYRVALMQGYEIDEYLPFITYDGTEPSDLVAAFDDIDPNFHCYKDLGHTEEVPCDWIRALKHFARGGSYRVGDCHNLAPGTTDQVPCSGHGFPVAGTCACDYAEEFELRSSGVGLAFELPGLTETPWRGKDCSFVCPGYDMKTMDSVCSGHGRCESDGRCACDQGYTGYKCDLECEQTQEVLSCSGHGTCSERLYRRGGSNEDIPESFSTDCTSEEMYLARDRVIQVGNVKYHMFEQGGLKVRKYPGGNMRDATLDDFYLHGTAVRKPKGDPSTEPYMPCKDRLSVKREEAVLPFNLSGSPDVFIDCNVLPGYEVRCGQCTCEETSQTGHWTGHDCRTPSEGYYGKDARSTCPGMSSGQPCNGGGTCLWGSSEGEGQIFRDDASKCFCGDTSSTATLATVPRDDNNRFIVYAMNGDTALYKKTFDSVDKGESCPDGTVEDTDPTKCVPAPLELENYNTNDCSCKFGWTGSRCDTPRMMCLFSGTETDGTKCDCKDNNGFPNPKVNDKGCCTKGTYWKQRSYKSFTMLVDFIEIGDSSMLQLELNHVCAMAPTTTELTTADMHDYIVNTDEYVLEPSACDGAETVPLYNYVYRYKEDVVGGAEIVSDIDPEQECLQHCVEGKKQGFNLKGTDCRCLDELAFIDGDKSVFSSEFFTEEKDGNGKRYDIVYPKGCYKSGDLRVSSSESGSSYYLVPHRFTWLQDSILEGSMSLKQCADKCVENGKTALTWEDNNCYCGFLKVMDDNTDAPKGYLIKTIEDAKHVTEYLPNPKPCNIDSYMAFPEDMDNLCRCPIWEYEECGTPTGESMKYDVPLDDKMATKHSCIAECTKAEKGTARIEETNRFICHCGSTCSTGTGAYRLEHAMYKLTEPILDSDLTCVDTFWEKITDSSDCAAAARYINERGGTDLGRLPTTVNPPQIIPSSLDSSWTPVDGCGWSHGSWNNADYSDAGIIDYLIMGNGGDVSTGVSTPICKRSQECKCEGFYMRDGTAYTCPAGKYSDSCSTSCKECEVGKFSVAGSSTCEECGDGKVQINPSGPTACFACPAGYYVLKGHQECLECQAGTFTDADEQASCKDCPGGYYVGSTASIECNGCSVGTYSNAGASACTVCAQGKYENTRMSSGCKNCYAGRYQDQTGKTSCKSCGSGKYNAQSGRTSSSDCRNCDIGKFQDQTGKNSCKGCIPGRYQDDTGKTSCKDCGKGKYQSSSGKSSCTKCGGYGNLGTDSWTGRPYYFDGGRANTLRTSEAISCHAKSDCGGGNIYIGGMIPCSNGGQYFSSGCPTHKCRRCCWIDDDDPLDCDNYNKDTANDPRWNDWTWHGGNDAHWEVYCEPPNTRWG